ncbi:hypothetical protein NIES4071_11200 [Calothrix sp. NIES-4071]|nr:hypothetical protein NIES4071_11200 [Calothrix sp. NIES-4071]BAZ55460.1 hypothetical protein NIES4105_11160 [Calothrix sp. NIES-4105]
MWILDTDTLTLYQNRNPRILQRLNQINFEQVAVTAVTVEEQMRGWLDAIRQSSEPQRLVWGYLGLRRGIEFFNRIRILDFDQNASEFYKELKQAKIRVGTQDLRIAAIAISNNAILVTRNLRDFSRIPNLKFEDWTLEN